MAPLSTRITAAFAYALLLFPGAASAQTSSVALWQNIAGGVSGSDRVATTEVVQADNQLVYLVSVSSRPNTEVLSVEGLGLVWRRLARQCTGRNTSFVEVWIGVGTPSQSGVITARLSEVFTNAVLSVLSYSGVGLQNPVGSIGSVNSNGLRGSCADGTDTRSYQVTLDGLTSGSTLLSFVSMRHRSHTPSQGFTEIKEIHQGSVGDAASLAISEKAGSIASAASVAGELNRQIDWAAVAVELLPAQKTASDKRFTLDTEVVGQGALALSPPGGVYDPGTQVSITALPEEQWQFDSWSGSLQSTADPLLVTMDSDKLVIATFVQAPLAHFELSMSTVGEGTITVTPAGQTFLEDSQVHLNAIPNSGWRFSTWHGDLATTDNPVSVTMNGDKNITAVFVSNNAGQAVMHEETVTGVSAGASLVRTDATIDVQPEHIYLAAVSTRPLRTVADVAGSRLQWQRLISQCAGRSRTGVELWWALGQENEIEATEATLAGPVDHAAITVSAFAGVSSSDQFQQSFGMNTNGVAGDCAGGIDTKQYAIDVNDLTVGATVFGATAIRNRQHAPGTGFLELAQVHSGTSRVAGLAIQAGEAVAAGALRLSGQFDDTVDWATAVVAIKPNGQGVGGQGFVISTVSDPLEGGEIVLNPVKESYDRNETVLVQAQANPGYVFVGWQENLHGYDPSATLLVDDNKLLTALFRQIPPVRREGILINAAEIKSLPVSGIAWENMKAEADQATGTPDVSNQDDPVNVRVLAKALVYARTGIQRYRDDVILACQTAIDTEKGGRTLALGRELLAYVVAADIVGLPPDIDELFKVWLRRILNEDLDGRTLQTTHEDRPNNWGTNAGASRAAVARYLGDSRELARTALVLQGYLGDRTAFADFDYGELSWQADETQPVGVNPAGAVKNGFNIDGVLPDDMRRGGKFQVPPAFTGYPWGALQGTVVQAEILYRAGYDSWTWSDQAILRSVRFLFRIGWPATGDDDWVPWIINAQYGSSFPAQTPTTAGKNFGWMDWLYGGNFGLTVSKAGAGTGSVEIVSVGRDTDGHVIMQLTATPNATSIFTNWSGTVSSEENPLRLTLTADTQLLAAFEKVSDQKLSLTVETVGEGQVELNPAGGIYDPGTPVSLTAQAFDGWTFTNWQGDIQGTENPALVQMDAPKSVTAEFSRTVQAARTLIIHPVADTYVKSNLATNFGGLEFLKVRRGGTVFRSLLKFVANGIAGTPVSAKLRLYVLEGGPDGGELQRVSNDLVDGGGPWLEDNVSWSNAPAFNQDPLQMAGAVIAGTWVEFDLSSEIVSNGTYSFGLQNADATVVKYGSKESANSPELVVELGPTLQNRKGLQSGSEMLAAVAPVSVPTEFALSGNYPNPFNPETSIEYDLPIATAVELMIYNLRGQIVRVLANEFQEAGAKAIQWDGKNTFGREVASGIYFVRLSARNHSFSRKILLQK